MGLALVAAFIGIPVLEIAVFIQAGGLLGLWPTLGIVVLTAIIGAALVRHQGFATLTRAQQSLEAGRFPLTEVFDGVCLLVAGAFLLTPGFITDTAGFLLLVPSIRRALRTWAGRRLLASGRVTVWADEPAAPGAGTGVTIEGDFEPLDEADKAEPPEPEPEPDQTSPWRKPPPGH